MHEFLIVDNNKFYKIHNIVTNEAALCPQLEYTVMLEISMCNHMVMSEGNDFMHAFCPNFYHYYYYIVKLY